MKKNIIYLAAAVLFSAAFVSCSDWTDAEPEKIIDYGNTETARPASYYKALRSWKNSEHSISFGWFSGWGENAASTTNMLAGIPDSMDVVSLWGNWSGLTEERKADLKFVQQTKGTKIVFCSFTQYVGQNFTPESHNDTVENRNAYWGWIDGDDAAIESAIRKYAHAIVDTVYKYNYDGFDIDYEPHYGYSGELASNNARMHILIEELGKFIGPKSPNPDKLLIVDGEPQSLNAETGPYISYFVIQAYSGTSGNTAYWRNSFSNLDSRLRAGINKFGDLMGEETVTNRYVMTENLEPALDCLKGGYSFYDYDGNKTDYPSLIGMAKWEPFNDFRKGGFGAYQFGYEAVNKPSYKWMRTAIQIANPKAE